MKQVEVLQYWTGAASGFRQIAPGVYDADDEQLFGCVGYLLQNGIARRVEATIDEEDGLPDDIESLIEEQFLENLKPHVDAFVARMDEEILHGTAAAENVLPSEDTPPSIPSEDADSQNPTTTTDDEPKPRRRRN